MHTARCIQLFLFVARAITKRAHLVNILNAAFCFRAFSGIFRRFKMAGYFGFVRLLGTTSHKSSEFGVPLKD